MSLESGLFSLAMLAFMAAFFLNCISAAVNRQSLYGTARLVSWTGALLATVGLLLRWQVSGYPPLSNMYESLVTLATMSVWVALLFTRGEPFPLIEAGTGVMATLMVGLASLFSKDVRPLVPALQSYWLHLHVSIAFLGEACFALSFVMSYLFCVRRLIEGKQAAGATTVPRSFPLTERLACLLVVYGVPVGFLSGMILLLGKLMRDPDAGGKWHELLLWVVVPTVIFMAVLLLGLYLLRGAIGRTADQWLPQLDRLDEFTYRTIALGYPLFTVGALIFGMVWANKAWGRYWGWDPKETWALITFLVYSVYLHLRLTKGWAGTHTAVLAVVGFLFTMFTLFGVNLLISGLHSYAAGM